MATILLISLGFAVLTFIYCGIIAPTIRLRLRYRLFELRDRLRWMMHTRPAGVSQQQLDLLDSGINNAIKALPSIDFATYYWVNKCLDRDDGLREEIEKRVKLLDSCNSKEFQLLRKETMDTLEHAFIANVAVWFLYLVPIALIVFCLGKFKEIVFKVFYIPETQLEEVMPALAPA